MSRCSRAQARQTRRWAALITGSSADGVAEDLATYVLASARRHGTWSCDNFTSILVTLLRLDWKRRTLASAYRTVATAIATSVDWPEFRRYYPSVTGAAEGFYFGI